MATITLGSGRRLVIVMRSAALLVAAVMLVGCGRVVGGAATSPTGSTASTAVTNAPTPASTASPSSTPSIPPGWQTYSDQTYSFHIAYPPTFTFKQEGSADPAVDWLAEYRAVDSRYLNGYPPGQVEIGVYVNDADTLADWITKHTGSSSSDHTLYWQNTSDNQSVAAAGRPGIAFTTTVTGFPVVGHSTAFVQNSSRIIVFNWWATDSNYSSSISNVAQQMLASFNG